MYGIYNVYHRDVGGHFQKAGYRAFRAGTQNDRAMAANRKWRRVATYDNTSAKLAVARAEQTNVAHQEVV